MVELNPSIVITTLNVSLNTPINRLSYQTQKSKFLLCEPEFELEKTHSLNVKGQKKMDNAKSRNSESGRKDYSITKKKDFKARGYY